MKTWTLIFREVDKDRFEEMRSGVKVIETRAATPKYQPTAIGDEVKFVCGNDSFTRVISKKYQWLSVDEMVKEVPFKKVMPNVDSIEEMKKVYSSYPGYDQKIKEYGLLGFEFLPQ
jgi:ASC-1-like (ASCH) protein